MRSAVRVRLGCKPDTVADAVQLLRRDDARVGGRSGRATVSKTQRPRDAAKDFGSVRTAGGGGSGGGGGGRAWLKFRVGRRPVADRRRSTSRDWKSAFDRRAPTGLVRAKTSPIKCHQTKIITTGGQGSFIRFFGRSRRLIWIRSESTTVYGPTKNVGPSVGFAVKLKIVCSEYG